MTTREIRKAKAHIKQLRALRTPTGEYAAILIENILIVDHGRRHILAEIERLDRAALEGRSDG